MATIEDVLRIHRLTRVELESWVEQRWVRPRGAGDALEFDEVDEARIALIVELRSEFMVNDEALGVVLSLLDQLYAARRILKSVEDALDALPEAVRKEIRSRLHPRD